MCLSVLGVRVIVYEKEMHVGKWVCFQQSWTD